MSRSPRGLKQMMAVFVEVFGAFGLTISESKTETMCVPIPRATATHIVFNATEQQYHQMTCFAYLGGAVTETPNQPDVLDPRGLDVQTLHAGAVRQPEGKSAAPEGPDGEIRGSRGSPILMRGMGSP